MVIGTRSATTLSSAVAKEIRILLVRAEMRQSELAERIGVNEMWVSRRLRGAQPLTLDDLETFGKALGVQPTRLLEGAQSAMGGAPLVTVATSPEPGPKPNPRSQALPERPHPIGPAIHTPGRHASRRSRRITQAAAAIAHNRPMHLTDATRAR